MNFSQNKKDFQTFFFHKYKKTHLQRSEIFWDKKKTFLIKHVQEKIERIPSFALKDVLEIIHWL
jgi:predicted metallo-beta-lactamase superfamily hydrolase